MDSTDRRAAHRATSCRASLAPKCERLARLLRIAGLWCSSDGPHPWPQAKGQAGAGRQVPGGRKWILVAEDDRAVRTLLSRVLSEAGYSVVAAQDGVEALELARQVAPHLIILDLRMPGLSGLEFLARSREVPIVVLSGFLGDLPRDAAAQANVVAQLEKPVSLDTLRSTVERVLGR